MFVAPLSLTLGASASFGPFTPGVARDYTASTTATVVSTGAYAAVGGAANPTLLLTYAAPVSNDLVALSFQRHVGATDALRTGSYAKTLTFTLSTITP